MNKGVGNEQLHHAKEMHVAGDGDQPKPTEVCRRSHHGQRRGEKALKAGGRQGLDVHLDPVLLSQVQDE